MDQVHVYIMQIVFVGGISYGSQSLNLDDKNKWASSIARYVIYMLTIHGSKLACTIVYDMFVNKRDLDVRLLKSVNRNQVMILLVAIAFLFVNDQKIIDDTFPFIFVASLLVKYPRIAKQEPNSKTAINYGVGMACSYFEGYLVNVIPSDGAKFVGFEENINIFEARQGVVFPVKKLFIIVTKSLYTPPDLKQFNKPNRNDLAKLEACTSLDDVEKDVAGVKNRIYKNSAYKIYRPDGMPVCLSAESASITNTLYRVMRNKDLCEELVGINLEQIVQDFLTTLTKIISKSPECRDKCELIYFDDKNPELNLANVLLDRIRELEPNFEEIINVER